MDIRIVNYDEFIKMCENKGISTEDIITKMRLEQEIKIHINAAIDDEDDTIQIMYRRCIKGYQVCYTGDRVDFDLFDIKINEIYFLDEIYEIVDYERIEEMWKEKRLPMKKMPAREELIRKIGMESNAEGMIPDEAKCDFLVRLESGETAYIVICLNDISMSGVFAPDKIEVEIIGGK